MLCIFCGQTRRATKEHIYPQWVRRGLWATGQSTLTRERNDERRDWSVTGLTWILYRRICASCNGGWMRRSLEDAVRPLLLPAMRGQPIRLKPREQRVVAAWAVKTALLFQMKAIDDRSQPGFAPGSNLRWLYEHRDDPVPPPGSQVWIAYVDAQFNTAEAHPGRHNATLLTGPVGNQFYAVTFAVGYLVFQVIGQDFGEPFRPDPLAPLPSIQRPQSLISVLRSIWPERDVDIDWPPLQGLRHSDFRKFASFEGSQGVAHRIVPIPELGRTRESGPGEKG